jgi:midasin
LQQSSLTADKSVFALTGVALRLLERLAAGIALREPTLLVGETGIGKTRIVQHLAQLLGNTLVVQVRRRPVLSVR